MAESEYDVKLQQLMASYAESLPGMLADIEQHWQALTSGWDEAGVARLQKACHQVAGSAATFGFAEVSRIAREAEHTLRGIVDNGRQPLDAERQQIADCLERLRAQLDAGQ